MTISIKSLLTAYVSLSLISTVNSRCDDCHWLMSDEIIVSLVGMISPFDVFFFRAKQAETRMPRR